MTKPASVGFLARLDDDVTALCRLWTLDPVALPIMYFTDCDKDLVYLGNTYVSSKAFTASAIENSIGGSRTNLEVSVILDDAKIVRRQVERGFYDNAVATIVLAFYDDLSLGIMPVFEGTVQNVSIPFESQAIFTMLGSTGKMQHPLTEEYSPTCRADFGDARCTVNLESHAENFTIDAVGNGINFTASEVAAHANGYYKFGTVVWATGDNTGVALEVVTSRDTGRVTLFLAPPYPMAPGDTGRLYRGCAKTVAACTAYANLVNYRGEPYVPGSAFAAAPPGWKPPTGPAGYKPPVLPDDWTPG